MKTKFVLTLIIFLGFVLVFVNLANAQVGWEPLVKIPGMPSGEAPLGGYLVSLYNFLLAAVGIIAMVMIVYGGFRYMTSAGNPATMANAKDIVYSAIIGLALALLSWIIVSTINPELLFTTEPGMPSANLPSTSIGGNVPGSCAYRSLSGVEGPEPDENCKCIGDIDYLAESCKNKIGECETKKSDYTDWCSPDILNCGKQITAADITSDCRYGIPDTKTLNQDGSGESGKYLCASNCTFYNPVAVDTTDADPCNDTPNGDCLCNCPGMIDLGTCDSICKTVMCNDCTNNKKQCCLHADLKIGSTSPHILQDYDDPGTPLEIPVGGIVYFNGRDDSSNCAGKIARYEMKIEKITGSGTYDNICVLPTLWNVFDNISYGCSTDVSTGLFTTCTWWTVATSGATGCILMPWLCPGILYYGTVEKDALCGKGFSVQFKSAGDYLIKFWIYNESCDVRSYPDIAYIRVE